MNILSYGNSKLPKTWAIFNITAATDCPSKKLGLCQLGKNAKHCYACADEKRYPVVLAFRRRQAAWWAKNSYNDKFFEAIHDNRRKITVLRFNAAGDFRDPMDMVNAGLIADQIKHYYGIRTYCYTSRKDIWKKGLTKNMTVNGSGFMAHNEVRVVETLPKNARFVCPGKCGPCTWCLEKKGRIIYMELRRR